MKYKLNIQIDQWPAGTIVEDDDSSWVFPGGVCIDHRGSIREGELAMLLDSARNRKLTTILKPLPALQYITAEELRFLTEHKDKLSIDERIKYGLDGETTKEAA